MLAAVVLSETPQGAMPGDDLIRGAGATFPAPIYSRWVESFRAKHQDVQITYDAIGSEAGIERLEKGAVDFAAADFPPSKEVVERFRFQLLPTVVGAVVPVFNLPGISQDVRFTPNLLAGIYLGQIKRWNDPQIRAENPRLKLPSADIVVVHRSDGSGTTYVWSDYLSKTNAAWRSTIGVGSSLRWPVGLGAEGNEGVAERVARTPNSLGYVEFIYALRQHLTYGQVQNASGRFVSATIDSITAAARSTQAGDVRMSITNAPGEDAYAIASFTWLIVPEKVGAKTKRDRLVTFLDWALSSGQKEAAALGYVELPEGLAARERADVQKLAAP